MEFWQQLWKVTWFAGLTIFSILAVLITYHGAKDIMHLLRTLIRQHDEPTEDEGVKEGGGEGMNG